MYLLCFNTVALSREINTDVTLIVWSLLGGCHCHGEPSESPYGNNNHPHYLSSPVKVFDTKCMENYAKKPFMSSKTDDDMRNRASRSSGDCTHVTEEVNIGLGKS